MRPALRALVKCESLDFGRSGEACRIVRISEITLTRVSRVGVAVRCRQNTQATGMRQWIRVSVPDLSVTSNMSNTNLTQEEKDLIARESELLDKLEKCIARKSRRIERFHRRRERVEQLEVMLNGTQSDDETDDEERRVDAVEGDVVRRFDRLQDLAEVRDASHGWFRDDMVLHDLEGRPKFSMSVFIAMRRESPDADLVDTPFTLSYGFAENAVRGINASWCKEDIQNPGEVDGMSRTGGCQGEVANQTPWRRIN